MALDGRRAETLHSFPDAHTHSSGCSSRPWDGTLPGFRGKSSHQARSMIALITHTSEVAPAAFMAMLAASTTLTLAVGVSGATARGCACAVLLSSLALGFGLWATNLVALLSFWLPERSTVGVAGLIVPFAIAASSQMCALLFIACREPHTSEIAGSAFALAFGVGATHCAALGDPLGQLVLPDEFPW